MNKLLAAIMLVLLPTTPVFGTLVYSNSFDQASDIDDFIIHIKDNASINITPDGQLNISSFESPGGFGYGSVTAMLNVSNSVSGLRPVLNTNPGQASWSMNVSNSDGYRNNRAELVLASTSANPFDLDAHGYAVTVGGSAGDAMSLFRFNYGLGGGRDTLISIENGLSVLPALGALRVDYNPINDYWEMYFSQSDSYQNPAIIEALVGVASDAGYTGTNLSFIGLSGSTSGDDYFDNLSVRVIPEPSTIGLFATAIFCIYLVKRKSTR